jgi:hypothetical protein
MGASLLHQAGYAGLGILDLAGWLPGIKQMIRAIITVCLILAGYVAEKTAHYFLNLRISHE